MIKTIIFDNNGVLTYGDAERTIPNFAKYFGVDETLLKKLFNELVVPADLGEITTDEFFTRLAKGLKKSYDPKELWKIYIDGFQLKEGMQELVCVLKKNYEIAILTNFVDSFDLINRKLWHYEELFSNDKIFISSKLHMGKPNEDIFLYVLKQLGRNPEEVLFVDDRKSNVDAAKKLGMKGIVFTDLDNFKQELENVLEYSYV